MYSIRWLVENVSAGDVVLSTAGRDKGKTLLVVSVQDKTVTVVDGKTRKTINPKKKNIRHIKLLQSGSLSGLADRIRSGEPVSDKNVRKGLRFVKENF